jgi:hypothetical protein
LIVIGLTVLLLLVVVSRFRHPVRRLGLAFSIAVFLNLVVGQALLLVGRQFMVVLWLLWEVQ